jgi:hypothetical protein
LETNDNKDSKKKEVRKMCWSGSEGIPGMDSTQEEQERTGKKLYAQSYRIDQMEFNSLKSRLKDLEAEVESLKIKALLLLVICVVISIFASFSVMNIARQYSTIHDYYMDSQRNDRETGRSLDELIQKIEEFDAKTD